MKCLESKTHICSFEETQEQVHLAKAVVYSLVSWEAMSSFVSLGQRTYKAKTTIIYGFNLKPHEY